MEEFCLESYLTKGVENIVKGIVKTSLKTPRAGFFMVNYVKASKRAALIREQMEKKGEHIPPFLIASITEKCNLRCKGCYARANQTCSDHCNKEEMTGKQWGDIFQQAEKLGIIFILIAGGEPLTRREILEIAGQHPDILFPVFTNGTMVDKAYVKLFSECRNLIPILSMEGTREHTDTRRGPGVYDVLRHTMKELKEKGILFGISVTVTKENVKDVLSEEFTTGIYDQGGKAVIYVEYVPTDGATQALAPDEKDRKYIEDQLKEKRVREDQMLFISFPGDEKSSGGCLAAGRGFFHINARGGAEPCPFSPYSDTSLLYTSLRDALHSPLFLRLSAEGMLNREHTGGCVLYDQEQQVIECLKGGR